MNVDIFVDTNILVYAHDRDAGEKHTRAKALLEGFWETRQIPSVSVQVLQELHVNLVKKGITLEQSGEICCRYLSWRVVDNTRHLFRQALADQQRWQVSYWDGLILAAARQSGATTLWSEDLNAGQDYGGIRVTNPLALEPK